MIKLITILISLTTSFQIFQNYELKYPRYITPCYDIDKRLFDTLSDVVESISDVYPVIITNTEQVDSTICNEANYGLKYGYLDLNTKTLGISNLLLDKQNTLYNVVLHEICHLIGLAHDTSTMGIMGSYSVTVEYGGSVNNDNHKLWLSLDDLLGLISIRNKVIFD